MLHPGDPVVIPMVTILVVVRQVVPTSTTSWPQNKDSYEKGIILC